MPSRKSSMKSGERSFTIEMAAHVDGCPTKFSRKDFSGRYVSRNPAGAASKALTQLCNVKKVKGQCTLFLKMRETTQGSKRKEYLYNVKREKLSNPVEITNGVMVEYKNVVKSRDSMPNCKKSHKSSGRMRKHHTRTRTSSSRTSSRKSSSKSSGKSRTKKSGSLLNFF
jgi:hypothetical protein